MNDFNLTTIYFILSEGMGFWLWALVALALVLLAGIVAGFVKLRGAGRPAKRPLMAALVTGLLTTVVFTFLVPAWTLTGPGALSAPIDYVFAFLFALVPGGIVASAVFFLAAMKCAGRARTA